MIFDKSWLEQYLERTSKYIQPPEILKGGCNMKREYEVEVECLGKKIKGTVYCEPGQIEQCLKNEIKTKLKVIKEIKN